MSLLKNKFSLQVVLAFTGIYLLWGTTFLAMSYGLKGFPPFLLSSIRFIVAGAVLFIWRSAKGEKSGSLLSWKKNAITGVLILTGGTGLVAWGEQYVTSTEAAIAIATGPFWFLALDKKNWQQYFSNKLVIGGLLIGFSGLVLFLQGSMQHNSSGSGLIRIIAFIILAASSISWVLGSLYSKNNPAQNSTVMNIAQQLIVAGFASSLISLFRGEWYEFNYEAVPFESILGLLFLIFFGSIIAYLSYIWLLSVKDPILVSTHTYINPIVAVFMGWLVAAETISAIQFVGLAVILSGVLLTNMSKYKLPKRQLVKLRRLNQLLARSFVSQKPATQNVRA